MKLCVPSLVCLPTALMGLLVAFFSFCVTGVFARPISADEAARVALAWVNGGHLQEGVSDAPATEAVASARYAASGEVVCYDVLIPGRGRVITAAETEITPIVFFTQEEAPLGASHPLWGMVDHDIAARQAALAPKPMVMGYSLLSYHSREERRWAELLAAPQPGVSLLASTMRPTIARVAVKPLVRAKWDQHDVGGRPAYNYHTPNHYYTGCVATAAAQLMRYHEYPKTFTPVSEWCDVGGERRQLAMLPGPYDYDQMPYVVTSQTPDSQRAEIGKLMYNVGVATKMSFGAGESSTVFPNLSNGLTGKLGYKQAIFWTVRDQAEVPAAVDCNLLAGYPVVVTLVGGVGNHAILFDGLGQYESDKYYHLNFGWSGTHSGWYQLSNINTGPGVSSLKEVIFNVFPDEAGWIIGGAVKDPNQQAVADAVVTLSAAGMADLSVLTTATGHFAVKVPVNAGRRVDYRLAVKAAGLATTQTVTIDTPSNYYTSLNRYLNLTLAPSSEAMTQVVFDANQGQLSSGTISYPSGGAYGALPTPTRYEYAFAGWYSQPTGGESITAASQVPTSATTLYARWLRAGIDMTAVSASKLADGRLAINYAIVRGNAGSRVAISAIHTTTEAPLVVRTLEGTPSAATGSHTLIWDCATDNPGIAREQMRIDVTLTPQDPLYVMIDVSGGPTATTYPMTYLDTAVFNDGMPSDHIILRRIDPGTFKMGSPAGELGRDAATETQHDVTVTRPYYLAIFELTQKQYALLMGDNPATNLGDNRPADSLTYAQLRGADKGSQWPASTAVDAASLMGKLRAKTQLLCDLPTEAQWEYACRAGTTTGLNSGEEIESSYGCNRLAKLGRYFSNQTIINNTPTYGPMTIGHYLPNQWGLYDTHGNVYEWCLDWHQANLGGQAVTDPAGPATGTMRVLRGGGFRSFASDARAASRKLIKTPIAGTTGARVAIHQGRYSDGVTLGIREPITVSAVLADVTPPEPPATTTPRVVLGSLSGRVNWGDLPWAESPDSWQDLDSITLTANNGSPVTVVVDRAVAAKTVTITGEGVVTVVGQAITATTIDLAATTGAVTLDLATGNAAIKAGTRTILPQTFAGAATLGEGKALVLQGQQALTNRSAWVHNQAGVIEFAAPEGASQSLDLGEQKDIRTRYLWTGKGALSMKSYNDNNSVNTTQMGLDKPFIEVRGTTLTLEAQNIFGWNNGYQRNGVVKVSGTADAPATLKYVPHGGATACISGRWVLDGHAAIVSTHSDATKFKLRQTGTAEAPNIIVTPGSVATITTGPNGMTIQKDTEAVVRIDDGAQLTVTGAVKPFNGTARLKKVGAGTLATTNAQVNLSHQSGALEIGAARAITLDAIAPEALLSLEVTPAEITAKSLALTLSGAVSSLNLANLRLLADGVVVPVYGSTVAGDVLTLQLSKTLIYTVPPAGAMSSALVGDLPADAQLTLRVDQAATLTLDSALACETLTIVGEGELTLAGSGSLTPQEPVAVNANLIASPETLPLTAAVIASGQSLTYLNRSALTLPRLEGDGTYIKQGVGTLTASNPLPTTPIIFDGNGQMLLNESSGVAFDITMAQGMVLLPGPLAKLSSTLATLTLRGGTTFEAVNGNRNGGEIRTAIIIDSTAENPATIRGGLYGSATNFLGTISGKGTLLLKKQQVNTQYNNGFAFSGGMNGELAVIADNETSLTLNGDYQATVSIRVKAKTAIGGTGSFAGTVHFESGAIYDCQKGVMTFAQSFTGTPTLRLHTNPTDGMAVITCPNPTPVAAANAILPDDWILGVGETGYLLKAKTTLPAWIPADAQTPETIAQFEAWQKAHPTIDVTQDRYAQHFLLNISPAEAPTIAITSLVREADGTLTLTHNRATHNGRLLYQVSDDLKTWRTIDKPTTAHRFIRLRITW